MGKPNELKNSCSVWEEILSLQVTEALSITKVHQFLTLHDINSIFLDVLVSLFYGMRLYLKN